MRKAVGWQTRPVFITSTFRDMHAERDWLRERIIPALEERLRERRAHLEPIDLRWGVENLSAEDEEAKELIVLKVCLDEIERSRPFLIGLIGDRYGWVPPEGRMQTAIDEKGFRTDVEEKSVTALEIEFGVLDSPDQRRRSHFFFRDPLAYDDMPPEVAAQYSDAHSADPDVRRYAQRLGPLKERIERELPGRVHHYSATWDAEAGEVTGLEAFAEMVLEALWADLESEIPPLSEQEETSWEDEERLAFEEFIELAARDFVGREQIAAEMLAFAQSPAEEGGTWGGCVTGPSGSGKSALLAHIHRQLSQNIDAEAPRRSPGLLGRLLGKRGAVDADMLLLSHFTGVTPRSQSVDAVLIRWIGELAEFLGEPSPVEEGASADELEEAFASLLGRAARRTRVVVLLDALNQFEPTTRARHMTWLPKLWPANARLIATAIPCQASDALLNRPGAMERLASQDPENAGWQHELSVIQNLVGDGRLAQGDLSGALSSYEASMAVAERLASQDPGNAGWQRHLSVSQEKVGDVRLAQGDLSGALSSYEASLAVAERLASQDPGNAAWQRSLAVSHNNVGNVRLAQGDVAGALAAYEAYREGIERLAAQDPGNEGWQRDLVVSQIKVGDVRLAQGDLSGALSSYEASLAVAERLASQDPGNAGWQRDLWVSQARVGDVRRDQGDLSGALSSYEASLGVIERLASQEPGNAGWQRDLAVSQAKVGDVRLAQGDLSGALSSLEACREILERLASQDPGNAGWQRDLSVSHNEVGDVRRAQGDLSGALSSYEASLAVAERLASQDPGNAGWQHDLSVSHERIGDVRFHQRDLSGALSSYEALLAVRERLASQDPGNARWQRDLSNSYLRMALTAEQAGTGDATTWWQKMHDTLMGMKQAGMYVSPQDERILQQAKQKLGQ